MANLKNDLSKFRVLSVSGRKSIVERLVGSLSRYLNTEFEFSHVLIVDEHAFSSSIKSGIISGGPFVLECNGILGMEFIDNDARVSASLFLYSEGRRISVLREVGAYYEVVLDFDKDPQGQWEKIGWVEDEFGEFDYLEGPDDLAWV